MRVVHVNTERGWRGGEQQLLWLLEGLAAVAAPGDALELLLVAQRGGALADRARSAGIDVVELAMGSSGDLAATWRLRRLIRVRRPDLLHLHTGHAHSIGSRAARWSGRARPRVLLHRHVGYSADRHAWPLNLHRIKFTWGVDRVVCVAEAVKDRMAASGIPRAHLAVVPNGIDTSGIAQPDLAAEAAMRQRAGVQSVDVLVGAVGALTPEKGHRHLIEAFALLEPARRGLRLAIAGDGRLREALETQAAALGIADRVRFLGFVDDVATFLRVLDLFVFPSLEEGAPVTVLQAMCAGAPVLATAVGGVPEMVRAGTDGVLVPPDDPAALSAAMADLLEAPSVCATLAANAAKHAAEAFDYHETARRALAVYRDVLSAGAR